MKRLSILLITFCCFTISNSSFAQTQNDTIKYSGNKNLSISIAGKRSGNLKVSEVLNGTTIQLVGKNSDKYIIESFTMTRTCPRMDPPVWNCQGNKICVVICSNCGEWGCHLMFTNIIVIDSKKKRWFINGASFDLVK